MDKEKVRWWLDEVVKHREELNLLGKGLVISGGAIRTCFESNYIQLYTGIEAVAEALGIELKTYDWNGDPRFYFNYKGFEVVQIVSKKGEEESE